MSGLSQVIVYLVLALRIEAPSSVADEQSVSVHASVLPTVAKNFSLTSERETHMKKIFAASLLAIALGFTAVAAQAQKDPMVGGSAMYPTKNIIQNAVESKDHTTLVAAVKAGGLVETLEGPGPFTVFAPTNEAFAKLPAGTVDNLLKPENKDTLDKILTYHVVPGRVSSKDLKKMIKARPRQGNAQDRRR